MKSKFGRSTSSMRSSLPLMRSARTNFESPKFELPSWAKSIPEYMDPESLKPAKQLKGFMNKLTTNLIEDLKREDDKILRK